MNLTIGIVKDNADPAQEGRLRVFIPTQDSEHYELDDLPWAMYVSPFAGVTANYKVGSEQEQIPGVTAYGMWAIPKNGAQVLIGFINDDQNYRVWMGCLHMPEMTRTLPLCIDDLKTEIDETGVYGQNRMPHMETRGVAAGLAPGDRNFKTRGGFERSVSHPSNKNMVKPDGNGYHRKPLEPSKKDSQVISITSPGRHAFLMSDVDEHNRVRLRTTNGSQILLDDTNERIYISTARGKNWIEMDEGNGRIYVYSDSKISIRAKNDINMYSDENINIVAKKRLNLVSEERGVKIQADNCIDFLSRRADIKLTASRSISVKTTDGPSSPYVAGSTIPGGKKGVITNWPEDGGSRISSINIESGHDLHLKSSRQSVYLSSAQRLNIKSESSDVQIQGSPGVFVNGKATAARGAQSSTVDNIDRSIIKPDHESWTRDEDESQHPTVRGRHWKP